MSEKKYNKNSLQGTVYVLLSAICFSLGGVLIKSIPWNSLSINMVRSVFIIYSDICLSENTGKKVCF
mgnify:CR=1 FL=1